MSEGKLGQRLFKDCEYDKGYAAAIDDAIYRLEECKGYTVDFNKHMDLAIHEIKALLPKGTQK